MSSDPYEIIRWRGVRTSRRTRAMVLTAEDTLGAVFPVYQGGWNPGGVDASGGTHDRDAIDLGIPLDPARCTRVLRRVGFAAWYRTPDQGFSPHIHAVPLMRAPAAALYLSPTAAAQCQDYRDGGDGLWPLTGGDDPQPYRPDPVPIFDYREWERRRILRGKVRSLSERIDDLRAERAATKRKLEKLS